MSATRQSRAMGLFWCLALADCMVLSCFGADAPGLGKVDDKRAETVFNEQIQKESQLTLADERIFSLAKDLPVEHRRYLVYLNARLERPKLAQRLAQTILEDNPRDKQTLLVLTAMYIDLKDAVSALKYAQMLVSFFPDDDQATYFLGAAYFQAEQYADANRVFRTLRTTHFADRFHYPYQTDLASSALNAGDWHRAMIAYKELLLYYPVSGVLRDEVRIVLDGIYRERLPQLFASFDVTSVSTGSRYRSFASYSRQLTDSDRIEFRYHRDEIGLREESGLRSFDAHREQAGAWLTHVQSDRWSIEGWIGGESESVFYGGGITRTFGLQRDVTLAFHGNDRALDSLALEALNGRANRLSLVSQYQLEYDWVFNPALSAREVRVEGDRLGHGIGLDAILEKILFRHRPELRAGYNFSYGRFWRSTSDLDLVAQVAATPENAEVILEGLIAPTLHRHGLFLSLRDNFADALHYRLSSSVFYSFDTGGIEYGASAGLSFFPRKSLELAADVLYSSTSALSGLESDITGLTISLRYHF